MVRNDIAKLCGIEGNKQNVEIAKKYKFCPKYDKIDPNDGNNNTLKEQEWDDEIGKYNEMWPIKYDNRNPQTLKELREYYADKKIIKETVDDTLANLLSGGKRYRKKSKKKRRRRGGMKKKPKKKKTYKLKKKPKKKKTYKLKKKPPRRKTKRRRRRGGVKTPTKKSPTKKSPTKKSPTKKSPIKSQRKRTPKRKRAYIAKNKPPKRTPNNVSITVQELEPIKEDTDEKAFRKLFQTSGIEITKPNKLLKTRTVPRKSLPPHYWTRDGHNKPIKYLNTRKGGRKRRRRRTKKRTKRRR